MSANNVQSIEVLRTSEAINQQKLLTTTTTTTIKWNNIISTVDMDTDRQRRERERRTDGWIGGGGIELGLRCKLAKRNELEANAPKII